MFAFAMYLSGKIPRWSAIAYAIAAPLNIIPHYIPTLWLIGAVLLLIASLGIVMGVRKISNDN